MRYGGRCGGPTARRCAASCYATRWTKTTICVLCTIATCRTCWRQIRSCESSWGVFRHARWCSRTPPAPTHSRSSACSKSNRPFTTWWPWKTFATCPNPTPQPTGRCSRGSVSPQARAAWSTIRAPTSCQRAHSACGRSEGEGRATLRQRAPRDCGAPGTRSALALEGTATRGQRPRPCPEARIRISPSCTTETTRMPSRVNRRPWVKPRAPEAEGLSCA